MLFARFSTEIMLAASSCEMSDWDFRAFSSVVSVINHRSAVCKRCFGCSHVVISSVSVYVSRLENIVGVHQLPSLCAAR